MSRIPIFHGGLMRCCLQTLEKYEGPETLGTKLHCLYCTSSMVVATVEADRGPVIGWTWDRELEA